MIVQGARRRSLCRDRRFAATERLWTEKWPEIPNHRIRLLPQPGGGFDRRKFLKTPMLAWRVGGDGMGAFVPRCPERPSPRAGQSSFPTGLWFATSSHLLDSNGPLQTWINLEIEWMKVANCSMDRDDMNEFSSPREAIFCNGGPIARAIVTMMSWRTDDWIGTPETPGRTLCLSRAPWSAIAT